MTPLDQYLRQDDAKKASEVAQAAKTTEASISRIRRGVQAVSLDMAQRLHGATDGAVPVSAWPHLRQIADAVQASAPIDTATAPEGTV